jgi:hypothetical protein
MKTGDHLCLDGFKLTLIEVPGSFMIFSIIFGLKISFKSKISFFNKPVTSVFTMGVVLGLEAVAVVVVVIASVADLSSLIFLDGDVTRAGLAVRAEIFLMEKLSLVGPCCCEVSVGMGVVSVFIVGPVGSVFFGDISIEYFSWLQIDFGIF